MRVDEFVWMLMRESGYYALSGTLPGGRQRQANQISKTKDFKQAKIDYAQCLRYNN